jgi:hypothetical protein
MIFRYQGLLTKFRLIKITTRWTALTFGALLFLAPSSKGQAIYTEAYAFTTLAGQASEGSADGLGEDAQFSNPECVALDGAGNIYVADTYNDTIRKVSPAGVVTTLAGLPGIQGSADGAGSSARFAIPTGIALDSATNIYVADDYMIRKVAPVGTNWVVTTLAGQAGISGTNDGDGTNAQFGGWGFLYYPPGVAVDGAGNIYVGDTRNHTIRKVSPVGTNWVVTTLAGLGGAFGTNDGVGSAARFFFPCGVAVDTATNIYVADEFNYTIREVTPVGTNWVVSTIAGLPGSYGGSDGTNSNARFALPTGVAVDGAGDIYVANMFFDSIRKIISVGTNWVVTTLAGTGGESSVDGTGTNASFNEPYGLAVGSRGNVYVADTHNNTIRMITPLGLVTTVAGIGLNVSSGIADGTGNAARFNFPEGVAVDNAGDVYVADVENDTIREITSEGVVSTIAGLAGKSGTNDGVGTDARFDWPQGVTVDSANNVFVSDTLNNTIREILPDGMITTLAGQAGLINRGTNDGVGSAATFYNPQGLAVDDADNIYVADTGNDTIRKVMSVGTNWVVTTLAGQAGISGTNDGTGSVAKFSSPSGVAIDSSNNLYVADFGNNNIRKLTPVGTNWVVSTIAGLAGTSGSADGAVNVAQFDGPEGVAVDSAGNVYVADTRNYTIRKITTAGFVSTIAGISGGSQTDTVGSSDGTGSAARFFFPYGVAVDNAGNVYVADTYNNTIRKGVFMAYGTDNAVTYNPPAMSGSLEVILNPSGIGQWQFPWDQFWRSSGDVVSNLVPGNYPVVFADVPNYLPYPSITAAAVTNNGTCYVTNQYLSTSGSGPSGSGSLTVQFYPNSPPSGGGWRFIGGISWNPAMTTNIQPGAYYVQFQPVTNYSTPASQAVVISSGVNTIAQANYQLAQPQPSGVLLPQSVVPGDIINDMTAYPFGFNGQLVTDVGYGSGIAVQANVVLTAAHLMFSDYTLSYANQAYWYFEEESGVSEPMPMAARGWYILSDYATQRTNDIQVAGDNPGQSSAQSRNDDAAAVYFLSPCAAGGYSGYLPSDITPNPWLTGTELKTLVGYPLDGSEFTGDIIVPGQMYYTQPEPYPLSLSLDSVTNQQEVYDASWFLSFPGNSGGPLCVQYNGTYYPAGIYLGTENNESVVRAIDSPVVDLITNANAAANGDLGTNNASGGVITLIALLATTNHPALLSVMLGPPAAVLAGAFWQLQGDTNYYASGDIAPVTTTNEALAFSSVNGWNPPTSPPIQLTANTFNIITNLYYTVMPPSMSLNPSRGIGITGTTNTTYLIQYRTNLTAGQWYTLSTNTLGPGFNKFLSWPPTNHVPATYYRALWLP